MYESKTADSRQIGTVIELACTVLGASDSRAPDNSQFKCHLALYCVPASW